MRTLVFLVGSAALLISHGTAQGQAAVGEESSMSLALSYTFGSSTKLVYGTQGMELEDVGIEHHILVVSADYVTPLRRLTVEAQLPVVGIRWDDSGPAHFPEPGEWDDGSYHFGVTDFRAGLRFPVLEAPLNLAVAVAGSIPTNRYPTNGFAAPGHHLKALHAGVALARTLDPILPRLYFYGSYEFSLVERVKVDADTRRFSRNLSTVAFQAGYQVLDRLEVNLGLDLQKSHGGVGFAEILDYPESVLTHHDRLLREDVFLAGGGLGYAVTDSLVLGAAVRFFLSGANTRNANLFGLVASYQVR